MYTNVSDCRLRLHRRSMQCLRFCSHYSPHDQEWSFQSPPSLWCKNGRIRHHSNSDRVGRCSGNVLGSSSQLCPHFGNHGSQPHLEWLFRSHFDWWCRNGQPQRPASSGKEAQFQEQAVLLQLLQFPLICNHGFRSLQALLFQFPEYFWCRSDLEHWGYSIDRVDQAYNLYWIELVFTNSLIIYM